MSTNEITAQFIDEYAQLCKKYRRFVCSTECGGSSIDMPINVKDINWFNELLENHLKELQQEAIIASTPETIPIERKRLTWVEWQKEFAKLTGAENPIWPKFTKIPLKSPEEKKEILLPFLNCPNDCKGKCELTSKDNFDDCPQICFFMDEDWNGWKSVNKKD